MPGEGQARVQTLPASSTRRRHSSLLSSCPESMPPGDGPPAGYVAISGDPEHAVKAVRLATRHAVAFSFISLAVCTLIYQNGQGNRADFIGEHVDDESTLAGGRSRRGLARVDAECDRSLIYGSAAVPVPAPKLRSRNRPPNGVARTAVAIVFIRVDSQST